MDQTEQTSLIEKPKVVGFFDGSCWPINPGGTASYGWHLIDQTCGTVSGCGIIGTGPAMTVNVAEYAGMFALAKTIKERFEPGKVEVEIKGDSQMVINMVSGRWGRKNPHKLYPHLVPWLRSCRDLLAPFNCKFTWIPREFNLIADNLADQKTPWIDKFNVTEEMLKVDQMSWPI